LFHAAESKTVKRGAGEKISLRLREGSKISRSLSALDKTTSFYN
jgi:hypothetical protein